MIVKYIALLPEIILAFGIVFMALIRLFRSANTQKTFFTISKWVLILATVTSIIFYNRSVGDFWQNNNYNTLFKVVMYLLSIGWGALSLKRFQNKDQVSFWFYFMLLSCLLCFAVALSYSSLLLLALMLTFCQLLNFFLLRLDIEEEEIGCCRKYLLLSTLFCLILWGGILILWHLAGSSDYAVIKDFVVNQDHMSKQLSFAFAMITIFFLFALGVAPFHFWQANVVSCAILPVAGYLTFIPILAYFSIFVNLMNNVLAPLYGTYENVILFFGVLSVFLGAIGANSEDNLRKIFAYAGLYYIGVVIIAAADMQEQSLQGAFIYLFVYILAFFGVYTVLAGCRSKGEYLHNLDEMRGLSTQRPFLSATLLVLMISLIGTPPLVGFLGKLSVINALVVSNHYGLMAVVAFSVLILACAYLRVITAVYFEPRNINFDRVDKEVYVCIAVNVILIVMTVLNPKYLMHDVEMMLNVNL